MLRSLYAGITGMKVNQTKLDVTGNNIANVGTTAFKNSRVRFQDMLSQNMGEATGPGRNTGGVNGRQIGLGVQVAGIDTIVSQGMMQPTSRNLDAAVDGDGYFVVARGALPDSNAGGVSVDPTEHTMDAEGFQINYTRDGAFTLDREGNLLTSDGYRVMGYALQEKSGSNSDTLSIDYNSNGLVNFVDSDSKDGLITTGSLVPLKIPDSVHIDPAEIASPAEMIFTGDNSKLTLFDNDIAATAPGIQGFPTITTTGPFKGLENITVEIKYEDADKNDPPDKGWMIFVNGKNTYLEANSTNGTAIDVSTSTVLNADEIAEIQGLLNGSIVTVLGPNPDVGIDTDAESEPYSWSFDVTAETDKKIRSYSFEKDGVIKAVLDDGSVAALGQIALASFKNPEGLKKLGKNMYQNTANSGIPTIRSGIGADPANDNSDGYGDVLQGMLEMSNVDLAEQFTDMIVTTRAFQAAGKTITTGDEILQEIINLKR